MKIVEFIAPLYHRIYLEASKAEKLLYLILSNPIIGVKQYWKEPEVPLIRFFLTSSRSFKQKIGQNQSMNDDLKRLLIYATFPKFIWVAELSTESLCREGKAKGAAVLNMAVKVLNIRLVLDFFLLAEYSLSDGRSSDLQHITKLPRCIL
jgi:hypothetical protein